MDKKKFKIQIKVFLLIIVVYLIVFAVLLVNYFFDNFFFYILNYFSKHFKGKIPEVTFNFHFPFQKISDIFNLNSQISNFFSSFIPFTFLFTGYLKTFCSPNYVLSHLFYHSKLKKYLKKGEKLIFDEEDADLDIDLSGNFYHGDLILSNYPLIFLTLFPFLISPLMYYFASDWDDLDPEGEEEELAEKQEEIYASLDTSLFDEYCLKNPRIAGNFNYYRTERLLNDIQDESLEDVMEDKNFEDETDYLDFFEHLSEIISNLIFNKFCEIFPAALVNFFKFKNTELALQNLIIFILYVPILIYLVFKQVNSYFKNLFKK